MSDSTKFYLFWGVYALTILLSGISIGWWLSPFLAILNAEGWLALFILGGTATTVYVWFTK